MLEPIQKMLCFHFRTFTASHSPVAARTTTPETTIATSTRESIIS
jgi:hypothetical protein